MTSYVEKASRFIYYYIFFIVGVVTFILATGMFGSVGLIAWVIMVVVLAILVIRRRRKVVETMQNSVLV
jgi:LPXTG-motif cell wall-anchored protein